MKVDCMAMTDAPKKARGKSRGQKMRSALDVLTARSTLLRQLAAKRADAGEGHILERADADALDVVIGILRGNDDATDEAARRRILAMFRHRRGALEQIIAARERTGQQCDREKRERSAIDTCVDELAARWVLRS